MKTKYRIGYCDSCGWKKDLDIFNAGGVNMKIRIVNDGKIIEFYNFKNRMKYWKFKFLLWKTNIDYKIRKFQGNLENKELKFIFKGDSYRVHLENGYEPIIERKRVISSNHTEHYTFLLFYLIGVMKRLVGDCWVYLRLTMKGYLRRNVMYAEKA